MNIRFLALMACLMCLLTNGVAAQFFFEPHASDDAVTSQDSEAMPKPISLLDEVGGSDNNSANENVPLENYDPSVSYYVQNLNLTPEQLSKVQRVSLDSLAEQEVLLQKIASLRQQVRTLEVNSLMAFEAILDDSQRTAFQELRAGYETKHKSISPTNELSVEPME